MTLPGVFSPLMKSKRGVTTSSPREDAGQVVLQQVQVQGLQPLVVVLPVLVAGRTVSVHEIVVHRQGDGVLPADDQLDLEPFGEGGLARARGAGDGDDLDSGAGGDVLGDTTQAL